MVDREPLPCAPTAIVLPFRSESVSMPGPLRTAKWTTPGYRPAARQFSAMGWPSNCAVPFTAA